MKVQKIVEVNLVRKKNTRPVDIVQYDTGIQLVFRVLDFEIPASTTATLYVQKPSGKFVYQEDGITVSGNTITVDLENQAVTEHGTIPYQVQLANGSDLITTFAGIMRAEKSLADAGAEESKTVITAFGEMTAEKIAEIQAATQAQIAQVEAASEAEQAAIENKGLEVLNTIPADYQSTYNMALAGVKTKADAIVQTVQGEAVAVADASDDSVRSLRVFGKSKQATTTGKNLFSNKAITTTVEGITFTVNADGSVTCNGTATNVSTLVLTSGFVFGAGVQYTLSGCPSGGGVDTYRLDNTDKVADDGAGATVTYDVTTIKPIRIRIASGVTVSNLTFYPMMRYASEPDGTYEPYSGGEPSPSPKYPQEIVNIGNVGSIALGIYGKNLITSYVDASKTINGITFTVNPDRSITCNGTATEAALFNMITMYELSPAIQPGMTYKISGTKSPIAIQVYEWQKTWIQRASTSNETTFTLNSGAMGILVRLVINPGVTVNNLTVYPMLRIAGNSDSTYEQAKSEQSVVLSTPSGLPGIPVPAAGNYTDANGQQWYCDEVDLERGVYIQRCFLETVSLSYQENLNRYTGTLTNAANAQCAGTLQGIPVLSTEHIFHHSAGSGSPMINGIRVSAASPKYIIVYHNGNSLKTATVLYPLAEPIEKALTAEEIQAYKALHSNYLDTTVVNNAGAGMEFAYNADLRQYMRNNVFLVDESTGIIYKLKINNGKIYAESVVSA